MPESLNLPLLSDFNFCENVARFRTRYCDACEKDVLGFVYPMLAQESTWPIAMLYEASMYGMTLHLNDKVSTKCLNCGQCCYHVACELRTWGCFDYKTMWLLKWCGNNPVLLVLTTSHILFIKIISPPILKNYVLHTLHIITTLATIQLRGLTSSIFLNFHILSILLKLSLCCNVTTAQIKVYWSFIQHRCRSCAFSCKHWVHKP